MPIAINAFYTLCITILLMSALAVQADSDFNYDVSEIGALQSEYQRQLIKSEAAQKQNQPLPSINSQQQLPEQLQPQERKVQQPSTKVIPAKAVAPANSELFDATSKGDLRKNDQIINRSAEVNSGNTERETGGLYMNEILAFTLIALILVLSPGPNNILILKTVASKGKKAGIQNILGLVSATFLHGTISILGLSAIILQSAELFALVKYIGAAYLLYLGCKTILATFKDSNNSEVIVSSAPPNKNLSYINFIEGFLTQVLNPKVSMFYLAAFPQFLEFGTSNYSDAFLLVTIHASIIFFWFLGLTVFIQKIKILSKNNLITTWVQRISGGLLIYFGGLLATQEASR